MPDKTTQAVLAQVAAMQSDRFEVGVLKGDKMLLRSWPRETVEHSVAFLKSQNVAGSNIYIRPEGEHSLTMVDDLSKAALERMKKDGFQPALVVETSPNNYQAWLQHGVTLPKDVSTAAAKQLAHQYGGDEHSADWRHFGRLAGFTNRKPSRQLANGMYPFTKLIEATARTYDRAGEFTAHVQKVVAQEKQNAEYRRMHFQAQAQARPSNAPLKTIDQFRADPRYNGDMHRADVAFAMRAMDRGVPASEIEQHLRSRDLTKKGNERGQQAYIDKTLDKAQSFLRRSTSDRLKDAGRSIQQPSRQADISRGR